MAEVFLEKYGTRLLVAGPNQSPLSATLRARLEPRLGFTEERYLKGWERAEAQRQGRPVVEHIWHPLAGADDEGRLYTAWGFYERVVACLQKHGVPFQLIDREPPPKPEIYRLHWDRIDQEQLRYGQKEVLQMLERESCGRVECPAGYGKSFLIALAATALPECRILVTTKRLPVLATLDAQLRKRLPNVGLISGESKRRQGRVLCVSAFSLQHVNPRDFDMLLGDESHELATDALAYKLSRFRHQKTFGFSANQDQRRDGRDAQQEAIFGPVRLRIGYQEAVRERCVTPIAVHWRDVGSPSQRQDWDDEVARKRHGLWRNLERNRLIAADALHYGPDVQVLVTVDTVEHGLNLLRELPDFELVYAAGGGRSRARQEAARVQPMNPMKLHALRRAFEQGSLKRAIATTVWSVGVDFRALQILLRAEGTASAIASTQVPGRTSRLHDGKEQSVLHDYFDLFNEQLQRNSVARWREYRRHGWEQNLSPRMRDVLQRLGLLTVVRGLGAKKRGKSR